MEFFCKAFFAELGSFPLFISIHSALDRVKGKGGWGGLFRVP